MAMPSLKGVKRFLDRPLSGKAWNVVAVILKCLAAVGLVAALLAILPLVVSPQTHWLAYVSQGGPDPPRDFTGTWRRWYGYGHQYMADEYVRGKRNGRSIQWDEQGRTSVVASYKDDLLNGARTSYFTNGAVYQRFDYVGGKFIGPWIQFYSDGRSNEARYYSKPGVPDGPVVLWTKAGERKVPRVWREGQPWEGKFYSMSNQDEILRLYTNGVLVSETNLGPARQRRPMRQRPAATPTTP